jgi:hypothetical protein
MHAAIVFATRNALLHAMMPMTCMLHWNRKEDMQKEGKVRDVRALLHVRTSDLLHP